MSSPVEEIKNRLSIEEVIGSYIELKQLGKTQKALCPFHREKTPSFVISEERQSFYCFGCNKGGDMFTFVEEFEGVDFKGALKILAEKAGVNISEYQRDPKEVEVKNTLYDILDAASEIYASNLKMSEVAREYVKKRGITDQTIESFNLGFAPDSWSFILDALMKKGFDPELIEETGLVIEKERGGFYDRFRNRVMFPISDSSGRVIAFSGRTLSTESDTAKYINSPETSVFKKRDVLFGIDKAKQHIRRLRFSILVEGQMDLVLSHQAGFRNTVATSGTALSEKEGGDLGTVTNLELAKRLSRNLVIAFDSDEAGKKASIKNAQIAFKLGMDVKIATLPLGKDPADVILEDKSNWKKIIRESKDVVEFQLDEIEKDSKDKKGLLKKVRDEVFETIAQIPSAIEREHYLNTISDRLGMRSEVVLEEFMSRERVGQTESVNSGNLKDKPKSSIKNPSEQEKSYLASLISLKKDDTSTKSAEEYEEIFDESHDVTLSKLDINERERILFLAEAKREGIKNLTLEIEYLLRRFRIKKLEEEARDILDKIKSAENEAEKSRAQELLETYSQITQKIETLKET